MLLLMPYQVTCKIQSISLAFYKYSYTVGSLQLYLYQLHCTIIISTALSLAKKLKIIEAVEKGDKSHLM